MRTPPSELLIVRHDENHMATTFELQISCARARAREAEAVLADAHSRIRSLERELSEFLPESPIYRLNRAPVGTEVALPSSAIGLLERCEKIARDTDRAFDCTAKSQGLSHDAPSSCRVAWDLERRVAWRLSECAVVGFGAIGKGYALDEASLLIERQGFSDFLLNAGGSSLVFSGFSSPRKPWRWGWSWSRSESGAPLGVEFAHGSGERIAMGISGLHEKGEHLIDPKRQEPVRGLRSSLVAHPSAAMADALSTALFVGSGAPGVVERALPWDGKMAIATIDSEGVPRWNGFFQKLWGSIGVLLLAILLHAPMGWAEDGAVDLSSMGGDRFTPYLFDRSRGWILLPAASLVLVLLHLTQQRPPKRAKSRKES